jgi:hypothetical protein
MKEIENHFICLFTAFCFSKNKTIHIWSEKTKVNKEKIISTFKKL